MTLAIGFPALLKQTHDEFEDFEFVLGYPADARCGQGKPQLPVVGEDDASSTLQSSVYLAVHKGDKT